MTSAGCLQSAAKRRKLSPVSNSVSSDRIVRRKANDTAHSSESKVQRKSMETELVPAAPVPQQNEVELPPVKGLDSSDPAIRRKTLSTMFSHLQSRPAVAQLSVLQCLQLWRGMFVQIYMHDSRNMISVQNLIKEIAGTLAIMDAKDDEILDQSSKIWLTTWHATFHQTLVREWPNIDSHRMNKYLLLVRLLVNQLFTICLKPFYYGQKAAKKSDNSMKQKPSKRKNKVAELTTDIRAVEQELNHITIANHKTTEMLKVLQDVGPLNPRDRKISDGLRLHLLDIWHEELQKAYGKLDKQHKQDVEACKVNSMNVEECEAVKKFLDTFKRPLEVLTDGDSGAVKSVRNKAKEVLANWDKTDGGDDDDDES